MSEVIRREDLAKRVERRGSLSLKDAFAAVDAVFIEIARALAAGDKVQLRRFGIFEVTTRAARNARNLRTGEPIPVPKRRVPRFRPGSELRRRIVEQK